MEDKTDLLAKLGIKIDPSKLITEEQKIALQEARKKEERMERVKRRLDGLTVPRRLFLGRSRINWDGVWGQKARVLMSKLGTGTILVFRGPPGTGKSMMAAEFVIKAITDLDKTAKFSLFCDIQADLKSAFGIPGGEQKILAGLKYPDVLVIDEVDWCISKNESATDNYFMNAFYSVINHRYNDMKDTILTSNKRSEEFERTTIRPIKSRIEETGGVVSFDGWTDWRSR